MNYKKITIIFGIVGLMFFALTRKAHEFNYIAPGEEGKFWKVQSIDTMKYSRDLSREKLHDKSFDSEIEGTIKRIADLGATHVAIATPYDSEFLPFLKRWVNSARKHNLRVWFRGNWSGWEEWFGYARLSREEHISLTKYFIENNPDLFENGDIFTACPECENGGPGDPRHNGDVKGHRKFLIDEYKMTTVAFEKIGKKVKTNYNSMNGDVANLVMDKATTEALGGVVAIDHYVSTPEKLAADIKKFAERSGGKVVLSEFGVPIPDIHGAMSDATQAKWINGAFEKFMNMGELEGVNYWLSKGGSSAIWSGNGSPRLAAQTIAKFFNPEIVSGFVKDESGKPIVGAFVRGEYAATISGVSGYFQMPYLKGKSGSVEIKAAEYLPKTLIIDSQNDKQVEIVLEKENKGFISKLLKFIKSIFS